MSSDTLASRQTWPRALGVVAGGLVLLFSVVLLSALLAAEPGEMLTRNTVRLSLTWYALALCLMMTLSPADWRAETPRGQAARWCWTWAIVVFLVHLAMAFHYYHQWSHASAFERTRQASGTGEGVYVSYLFTLMWAGDALWWWISPASYAARHRWLHRALHAFMLFIVFNGMVIYEAGGIRWAGLLMFAGLAAVWLATRGWPGKASN